MLEFVSWYGSSIVVAALIVYFFIDDSDFAPAGINGDVEKAVAILLWPLFVVAVAYKILTRR